MQNNVWRDLKLYCIKHDEKIEMRIEQRRGILQYTCPCAGCDSEISTFDVHKNIEKLIKERDSYESMGGTICLKGKKWKNRLNSLTILEDRNNCFEIGVSSL